MNSSRTERAILLKNLLDALVTSYQATHFLGTLEETISICEEIIDIQQKHHQSHSGSISDLGKSLYSLCRFHGSDMSQRTRCLELLREALRLRPTGHPLRDQALVDYARALQHIGFRQGLGSLNLLEEGITCSREALKLRPPGHPDHDEALSTLANGLGMKFEHCGGLGLLSDVIDTRRHILERCPPGHRERSSALNNLAVELRVRFEYQGGFETLAEAITHWREALQLHPVIQPPEFLTILIRNNLALALTRIFTHCGRSDSLPEAILLRREALQLLPEAHADRGRCIANLAESLLGVFRVRGSVDALTEAIALLRTALDAQPHGHPYRDYTLNILANALQAQFNHQPDVAVLFEAVSLLREALVISPHGHGWRIFLLHTLADLLSRSELGLWSEAITLYREALQICPAGFPDRSQILSGMGRCLLHWKRSSSHVSEGLLRLSEGYADSFSHVSRRLQNSLGDLKAVEKACDAIGADVDLPSWAHLTSQVLGIYAQVIGLLPRAANFGLDHRTRLQAIVGLDEIARNAAARALTLGRVSQAVEMLEEGRGVFWSQTLCLRATEFDGVPDVERKKLEELLHLLEHKARNAESLIPTTVESRERELEICRCLNEETEALVSKIRTYPDLSRFLLPPAFEGLFSRLPDGYVVILNAAHLGYYALLLHRPANLAVSLKLEAPRRRLESDTIRQHVDRATRAYEAKCHDWTAPRATNISNQRSDSFEDVLSLLWTAIVHPVVKELRLQVSHPFDRAIARLDDLTDVLCLFSEPLDA
jgi:tetratricopeptide (TPR) repeat protein